MPMEPNLQTAAQQRRNSRAAAHYKQEQKRRAALLDKYPELGELESALLKLQVSALVEGILSGVEDGAGEERARLLERRRSLLERHGLDEGLLAQSPYCPVCGDRPSAEPCVCLKAEYAREQLAALSESIDITSRCFERFDISRFSPEHREAMRACRDFCEDYANAFSPSSPPLFFNGGTGAGKTFLAACVLKSVALKSFWTEYETAVRFFQSADDRQFGRETPGTRSHSRYACCDLLVLDDLGTEFITQAAQTALYDLVNTRQLTNKATIITSNLTMQQLGERYLPQTVSRLRGEYELVFFPGGDLRLKI